MTEKVSYLLSMYPEFHETFVAREVEALRRTGTDIAVYSLKAPPPAGHDLYPDHRNFLHVAGFFLDHRVIVANLLQLLSTPLRYLASIMLLLGFYKDRPKELLKALAALPKTVYFARSIAKRGGILHAHWATIPTSMALVINKLVDVPVSVTAHAWDIYLTPKDELRTKIEAVKGVVTCTDFNVHYLRGLCRPEDREKIQLNYHGLDFDVLHDKEDSAAPSPKLDILAVGRLVEQKGFLYLIRALKQLSGVKASLSIIGEGPLRSELEAEATDLPPGVEVDFLGRLTHQETLKRMAASDVFVAPSVIAKDGDRDGIPNVVLEAMASGVPIIGTSVSGIPEVVLDQQTGLLIPSEDAEALADALRQLANDREKRQTLGANAKALVTERFDMDRNIDEFLDYLREFHVAKVAA